MGILLNVQLMYVYTPARKGDILVTNSPQVSIVFIDHGVRMSQWRCLCLMLASLRDPDWHHYLHPLEQSLLSRNGGENSANHAQILKLLPGSGTWCSHSCPWPKWIQRSCLTVQDLREWSPTMWSKEGSWRWDSRNDYFSVIHRLRVGSIQVFSCTGSEFLVLE